jgi:hypothetical protein
MRHQYTPVFRDLLTSRVWAMPAPYRAVWLWFQLQADPEGFVPANLAGVALGANVDLEDARTALDLFETADPDADPDDPTQGVIIMRVPRGFQILGFEAQRERAKQEGQKARNRAYMRRHREAHRDPAPLDSTAAPPEAISEPTAAPRPAEVDAPKPIPKTVVPKKEQQPPTPVAAAVSGFPTTTHTLDGWEPSQALRDEARNVGVLDFDERIAKLRTGPIGGTRGVIATEIDNYVRSLLGSWRTWGETERAKATQRALAAPSRGFGGAGLPQLLQPTAALKAYAAKHGLDIDAHVRRLQQNFAIESLGVRGALEELGKSLVKEARAKGGKGAAA